jgi:hypothetical protein
MSFSAVTLCVASQRVFIVTIIIIIVIVVVVVVVVVVAYFVIDSVWKLLETPSYFEVNTVSLLNAVELLFALEQFSFISQFMDFSDTIFLQCLHDMCEYVEVFNLFASRCISQSTHQIHFRPSV